MKVTNWRKKLAASLVAAGLIVPSAAKAVDIPLLDPSFENFAVPPFPGGLGYAYADTYIPTSAWSDDLNSPTSYAQDDADSNWLYDAGYAEGGSLARKRAAPRTGIQAMHGGNNYSAQVSSGVFESGKSYTFSVWSQGDDDSTTSSSRVWLYLFNGGQLFSEANSLTIARYAPDTGDFVNRAVGDTPVQSQAKWQQISLTHHVFNDAPEIGAPVGVAFWGAADAGVDDATLSADDISNFLLVLEVNTTNGQTRIRNQTGEDVYIDYYEIESATNSLTAVGWNSRQDQNSGGFPAGNGSGNGWEEAGGSTGSSTNVLSESYLLGNSAVTSTPVGLGAAFIVGGTQDLFFRYGEVTGGGPLPGDHNGDEIVNAADYAVWRDSLGDATNYALFKENFGATGSGEPTGPGSITRGYVRYVTSFGSGSGALVPEPSSVILVGIGLCLVVAAGRRNRKSDAE